MVWKKEKFDVPVSGRLPVSKFRTLENWCGKSFRKRSEIIGILLERVLEILEQQADTDQSVENFVRRLRLDPP